MGAHNRVERTGSVNHKYPEPRCRVQILWHSCFGRSRRSGSCTDSLQVGPSWSGVEGFRVKAFRVWGLGCREANPKP